MWPHHLINHNHKNAKEKANVTHICTESYLKHLVFKQRMLTSDFLRICTTNVNKGQYLKAHLESFEHLQVGGEGPAPIR